MATPRRRRPRFPLVEVVWMDAATFEGPFPAADIATEAPLVERHTTGYLVYEDAKMVKVAQTYDPDDAGGDLADVTTIPAPWVKRRRKRK